MSLEAAHRIDDEATFSDFLSQRRKEVDAALKSWFQQNSGRVVEASCYSLMLPSKRIRPIFCLETAFAFCGDARKALPAAMALEMVHTYSLIHDDLPAMDDDDLRRGQPTNHIKYGEAMAILAGDGLLTSAFEVLSKAEDASPAARLKWIRELSEAAGMAGMVLGQDLDIRSEETVESIEDLEDLHRKKTGALLAASVVMGAIAGGAEARVVEELRRFAFDMGLAFQIRDDVLDVEGGQEIGKPVHSDEKNDKPTYVSMLGLEKAKAQAQRWYDQATRRLDAIDFPYPNRLREITRFVVKRTV